MAMMSTHSLLSIIPIQYTTHLRISNLPSPSTMFIYPTIHLIHTQRPLDPIQPTLLFLNLHDMNLLLLLAQSLIAQFVSPLELSLILAKLRISANDGLLETVHVARETPADTGVELIFGYRGEETVVGVGLAEGRGFFVPLEGAAGVPHILQRSTDIKVEHRQTIGAHHRALLHLLPIIVHLLRALVLAAHVRGYVRLSLLHFQFGPCSVRSMVVGCGRRGVGDFPAHEVGCPLGKDGIAVDGGS
mmetsp:Transcript_35492/g.85638  ORF Transcript_35492/g.85638 Transcript_35492/m.85638 type:complete len:245 (-) Transcript_35492:172-906(-)